MHRDTERVPLAIVGAGVGGLTLAAVLTKMGVPVRLYEQTRQFARVGAGIQMGPNAMRVLSGLGLAAPLADVAFRPPSMRNREYDTGEQTFELMLGDETERTFGAPYYLLHRGDLHAVLQQAVDHSLIEFGRRLTDIGEAPGGAMELAFEDGSRVIADAVVGADGVHSRVREQLIGAEDASFTGRVAYRTVMPGDYPGKPDLDPCVKWWGPDRHIVIYYVSAGRELYFTTSVPDEDWTIESWSATGDLGELRATFADFHPHVRSVLDACPAVHKWAIYERDPLPTWRAGNAVLLGDACHPMTPYMAQGAATSMEDAVVLARCLKEWGRDGIQDAFRLYEEHRRPRTSRIQLESRQNRWLRHATDPGWVYRYDAWSAPLEAGDDAAPSAAVSA
jgi:salicylate hydroxylase/6-hydroxynicotinate 3-monooxygenase